MTLNQAYIHGDSVTLDFSDANCKVNMQITYSKFADLTADIPGDLHEKAKVYISHMGEIANLMMR